VTEYVQDFLLVTEYDFISVIWYTLYTSIWLYHNDWPSERKTSLLLQDVWFHWAV